MNWIYVAQKGLVVGSCDHDNEHPGSIKCGEILDWVNDY